MRFGPAYGAVLLAAVAACGPVPVERAEEMCFRQAELAVRPRGEVALGANSAGQKGGSLKLEISSDYIQGRDPSEVYNSCVYNRSGQLPTRPLYSRTDWKG